MGPGNNGMYGSGGGPMGPMTGGGPMGPGANMQP